MFKLKKIIHINHGGTLLLFLFVLEAYKQVSKLGLAVGSKAFIHLSEISERKLQN